MQVWAARHLQDSRRWPRLPQPKHVNLLCDLSERWREPVCRWCMGPSCKGNHSKVHQRECEAPTLKGKGLLISDIKEGKSYTCVSKGGGAISGVSNLLWWDRLGLGAPFICTLLPSAFFPQKDASLGRRSYVISWEECFMVLHPPGRDTEGELLFMELFCFFCDVH